MNFPTTGTLHKVEGFTHPTDSRVVSTLQLSVTTLDSTTTHGGPISTEPLRVLVSNLW